MRLKIILVVFFFSVILLAINCNTGSSLPTDMIAANEYDYMRIESIGELLNSGILTKMIEKSTRAKDYYDRMTNRFAENGVTLEELGKTYTFDGDILLLETDIHPGKLATLIRDSAVKEEKSIDANGREINAWELYGGWSILSSGGSYLLGRDSDLELCIKVAKGEHPSINTEEGFNIASSLVDFNATDSAIVWGEEVQGKSSWQKMCDKMEKANEMKEVSEKIVAAGYSKYFKNDYRAVGKILFTDSQSARISADTLNSNKAKNVITFLNHSSNITMFDPDWIRIDFLELIDNFDISAKGDVLVIKFSANWDQLLRAHEKVEGNKRR